MDPDTREIMELTAPTSSFTSLMPLRSSIPEVRSPCATSSILAATILIGRATLLASHRETSTISTKETPITSSITFWTALTGARNSSIWVVHAATQPVFGTEEYEFIWFLPLKK